MGGTGPVPTVVGGAPQPLLALCSALHSLHKVRALEIHAQSSPCKEHGAQVCSSSGSSRGQKAKVGQTSSIAQLTGPSSSTPPQLPHILNLFFLSIQGTCPAESRTRKGQCKSSSSFNCHPSLPKRFPTTPSVAASAHFSAAGSKSRLCTASSCCQGPSFREEGSGRGTSVSKSRAAGPGLLCRAKTPRGHSGSCSLWLFLGIDGSSASFSF